MKQSSWTTFTPQDDDMDRRLDRVARKLFKRAPLSAIYAAIRKGEIRINGKRASPRRRLVPGDRIEAAGSLAAAADPPRVTGSTGNSRGAARLKLFENDALLACNKPRGMLTHGAGSLAELVLEYLGGEERRSLSFSPGPLHRLDRNTSGIVLFPKTLAAARTFSRLQERGAVAKEYAAIVHGRVGNSTRWEERLIREGNVTRPANRSETGRAAATVVEPIATAEDNGAWYTLIRCRLESGRTHQIRAHAGAHGTPLEGDMKYGAGRRAGGYMLHAYRVALHDEAAELGFEAILAPPPPDFAERAGNRFGQSALAALFGGALSDE